MIAGLYFFLPGMRKVGKNATGRTIVLEKVYTGIAQCVEGSRLHILCGCFA
jgi:hypothetical protein